MLHQIRMRARIQPQTIDTLWIYILGVIMLKSLLFLATLHSPHSAGINISSMYFSQPPYVSQMLFIVIVMSFALLFPGRGRFIYYLTVDILISCLLIADLWYYRTNGTFLSIRFLLEPQLFNPMNRKLTALYPIDLVFLLDIPAVLISYKKVYKFKNFKRNIKLFSLTIVFSTAYISTSHYFIDEKDITKGRVMLFRNCWAPFQTMSNLSPLGYHGYDIYREFTENKRLAFSDSDKKEIDQWFKDNQETLPDNEYKSMFKGKNLIAIQVESLENFVIGQKVEGQEITPNLNRLLNNSLYFNNIHEQNNSGTSSDADLMINTSLLPVRKGMTFFRFPLTEYNSLPRLLEDTGYQTIGTHAELGGDYNWSEVYNASLKFQSSVDITDYNLDEMIHGYLSDGSLFNQFEPRLKTMKQPFYSYIVTLTSHGPFDMPEKYKYLKLSKDLDDTVLGAYFQSIRYVDEQIALLLTKLKDDGLLQNSVVMIYGDHTGVHKFYNDKIQNIKLEGDWWKADDKKIPLIMYKPDISGKKIETIGGHIDIMPTILYLLGVDESKFSNTAMGRILVKTNRNFTVLNYGDVVGNPDNEKEKEHMLDGRKIADKIIQGDYFKEKR